MNWRSKAIMRLFAEVGGAISPIKAIRKLHRAMCKFNLRVGPFQAPNPSLVESFRLTRLKPVPIWVVRQHTPPWLTSTRTAMTRKRCAENQRRRGMTIAEPPKFAWLVRSILRSLRVALRSSRSRLTRRPSSRWSPRKWEIPRTVLSRSRIWSGGRGARNEKIPLTVLPPSLSLWGRRACANRNRQRN
jgi:hypothetical protein